jgi:hypothetical protein
LFYRHNPSGTIGKITLGRIHASVFVFHLISECTAVACGGTVSAAPEFCDPALPENGWDFLMAKLIPASERITRARRLIQQARDLPVPETGLGKSDFSYIASVKDLMRKARDLIKFIPQTAGVSVEMKEEVKKVYEEIEQATHEILF